VQRMAANAFQAESSAVRAPLTRANGRQLPQDHQEPFEGNGPEPPPRSLADFVPDSRSEKGPPLTISGRASFRTATVTCPICGVFEGDEAVVAHHVDEHLT